MAVVAASVMVVATVKERAPVVVTDMVVVEIDIEESEIVMAAAAEAVLR